MEFLKNLTPLKIASILGSAVAGVIFLGFMMYKLVQPPMSILYTNLSPDDSSIIISRLEAMNVPYSIDDSGKQIKVPVSKVLMMRMSFAQEGIPKTGSIIGYEIFDKSESLGTSQFVHNVNLVRALEGEISRTISSLAPIDSARVHLVMPKKELFSKNSAEPSASIVLKMRGSQFLNKQEVAAVGHIVATAIPGLRVENVTIVDTRGKPLKLGSSDDQMSTLTDNITEYQHAVESRYKNIVEELLEKSVGVGKVKANVTAEIDFDREVTNSEVFDPDGQVLRSRRVMEESEKERENANEAGVAGNLPGANGDTNGSGRNSTRTDEVSNYEISKTITNKISESGRIKKLSLAILIDGIYDIKQNPYTEEYDVNYQPRPDDEIEQIKSLAASAIGIDPARGDKIEVINMRFSDEFLSIPAKEGKFDWVKNELDNIIQTIVIGIVIILVILLVVRPVIMRSLELRKIAMTESETMDMVMPDPEVAAATSAQETLEEVEQGHLKTAAEAGYAPDEVIDLTSNEDKRKINLVKQVNNLVEKHPDETVSVIRNWLYSNE